MKKSIHNYFSKHSIRSFYIGFIVFLIFLFTFVISFFSYSFTRKIIKEDYSKKYLDAIQNEIEKQLTYNFKYTQQIIHSLLTIDDIYIALNSDDNNSSMQIVVEETLASIIDKTNTICGIELYTDKGQYYSYFKTNIIPYKNAKALFGNTSPSTLCISNDYSTDGKDNYLIVSGKIFNFYNSYLMGNFVVYINQNNLQSFYQNLYNNGYEVFLASDGKIISHPDNAMLGKSLYIPSNIINYVNTTHSLTKGYFIDSRQITIDYLNSPLTLQTIVSHNTVLKDILLINTSIYIIIAFIFLISLFLAIILANKLTNNIRKLQKNVEDIETYLDNPSPFVTAIPPKNELFLLEQSFEEMRQKINLLLLENNKILNRLRIAELNSLQAQINPHFIYNALAAVSWTAKLQDQPQIVEIVSALSSYFRIGLHAGETFITIREELKHVQSYIYVEQIRFPGLFDVVYNIDEDIMNCYITKIVLQPLVENSINHGFKKKKSNGHLIINGFTDKNGDIILEVIDNGIGTSKNPLDGTENIESGHYGLKNVQERLKITYGNDYGLTFESEPGIKTKVQLKIRKEMRNGGQDV